MGWVAEVDGPVHGAPRLGKENTTGGLFTKVGTTRLPRGDVAAGMDLASNHNASRCGEVKTHGWSTREGGHDSPVMRKCMVAVKQ
ncbi:hypothetical protein CDL15_Pgr026221 [Punica granatum]|uniref:Uncharacterized protein n=1 Tax=Punica granatum TaxID=22663 RepID=A0A218VR88_PUNGR|nr:hypothetical protein CDL15_Pgr026221 [Punica granatum]